MAQASQKDRKIRRLKIEAKRANHLMEFALRQRDEARTITKMLTDALTKIKEQNPDIEFFKEPTTNVEDDQANRPNEDSPRLDMPSV